MMDFRSHNGVVRGFSLIEVLIAVLVLAIGVLGLGAVFTGVIPIQRKATDQILALSAAEAAQTAVLGHPFLHRIRPDIVNPRSAFEGMQDDITNWSRRGEWIVPTITSSNGRLIIDRVTGDLTFEVEGSNADVVLTMADRLFPVPFTRSTEPRFVWDVIARRVPTGTPVTALSDPIATVNDPIELAVFIRRVDPGIAVPNRLRKKSNGERATRGNRVRLSDVLIPDSPELSNAERRLAVGTHASQTVAIGVGLPSGDGTGDYALPFTMVLDDQRSYGTGPNEIERDHLALQTVSADDRLRARLARQVGQKIVDRFGTVYTVRGVDENDRSLLIVDPPVPDFVTDGGELGPVVLTAQVPNEVRVFRIVP